MCVCAIEYSISHQPESEALLPFCLLPSHQREVQHPLAQGGHAIAALDAHCWFGFRDLWLQTRPCQRPHAVWRFTSSL